MNNFKELIEKYTIQIPIIQRDYAQGREIDDITEIRDNFLEVIARKLEDAKPLHLDFIYGSIQYSEVFTPLDGQQRLTTLFLLYLYFGKKEKKDISFLKTEKESKFTYQTRASSREFCNRLVHSEIDFSLNSLSIQIKDSAWFLPYWENDPTIKSMFIMLDSIHTKFKTNDYFTKLDNITFEFFELEKFGLDDDLYIKMNARGKALTPFENFKANFESLLENVNLKLKKEFSSKIDKEWIDIFWKFKDKNFLIDDVFINYFYYISEMLYYKSNKVKKEVSRAEIKSKLFEIYNTEENIKFLFQSIDNLPKILKSFDEIFTTFEHKEDKVVLFDKDVNLSTKIITNSPIGLAQKIILFVVIHYFSKEKVVDTNLVDLLRVIRNILIRIRGLKQSKLIYTQNIAFEDLYRLLNLFTSFIGKNIYDDLLIRTVDKTGSSISDISLNQEIEKAKLIAKDISFKSLIFRLEDFKYLKGDINNFLCDDIEKFKFYVDSTISIYTNNNDSSIIQAMLSVENYTLQRGWAGGNHKYFFGKTDYWEIVLTSDKKAYFTRFLESYKKNTSSLSKMKNNFLSSYIEKDWIYYFIKYDEMINSDDKLTKDTNTYAWYGDFSLEKMGGINLNAYHINPYIRTVAIKAHIPYDIYKWDGYSLLQIDGKIEKLSSDTHGWNIKFSTTIDKKLKGDIISKYSLKSMVTGNFLLKIETEDRIEIIVQLIEDLK